MSPDGDILGDMEALMRATVSLDDELVRTAQEYSGISERSALLREALKALIHIEASRRLAALEGTMPDLENIPRTRADRL
jgi:Arc/MetJ family transcription regulator